MLDYSGVGLSRSQCVFYVANDFILMLCVISCIINFHRSLSMVNLSLCSHSARFVSLCAEGGFIEY